MKKYVAIFLTLVLAVVLVGCKKDDKNLHDTVFNEVTVGYTVAGDSSLAVTGNLTLPTTSSVAGATIVWMSRNSAVISDAGVITRPSSDTIVELLLQVTIDGVMKQKSFTVTVKAAEGNNNGGNNNGGNNNGGNNNGEVPPGYTAIGSVADFMAITNFGGLYMLTADIDFQGAEAKPLGGWNEDNMSNYFSGTFDGNGYALMNFKITGSKHESLKDQNGDSFGASLFPRLSGVVKNLNIINAEMVSNGFAGGLAGVLSGTVANVYIEAKVTSSNSFGSGIDWEVPGGGIAAFLTGNITNVVIDVEVVFGHVFFGYTFKNTQATRTNMYAVQETLGGHDLPKTGQTKVGETEYLDITLSGAQIVTKANLLTATLGAAWSKDDASRPYLIRKDGLVPNWAK